MELGVMVKLLTQQSAVSSATAVEINEDELVLALGFGHGLLQRTVEPVLGRSARSKNEEGRKGKGFSHICLRISL
jgi:CRISPR/Cas system CSM-associated protein Csm5 (group 7 of RAMP superfamily)